MGKQKAKNIKVGKTKNIKVGKTNKKQKILKARKTQAKYKCSENTKKYQRLGKRKQKKIMARKAQKKKNKGSKNTNNKTKILCYLIYIYFTNIWQTYLHNWTLYSTIHLTVISSSIDTWYALIYTTFSYQELPLKIDWNLQDSNMLRSLSNVYCFLDNWHHVSYNFISRICFSFPFNKNNIQPLLSLMFTVVFTLKCPFF